MTRNYPTVEIYTDGACKGNPGPGGYGAILRSGSKEKEISGCERQTTNNRMEMMAAIAALKCLKQPCKVVLTSDSNYLVKGMTQWLPGWIRGNWINSQKEPVKNKELWKQLLDLSNIHKIQWKHVRGHRGHPENERCDRLARDAVKGCI